MKKKNLERIKALMKEIMDICEEEKENSMFLSVHNNSISFWNSVQPKRKHIDWYSQDRGVSWSDVR